MKKMIMTVLAVTLAAVICACTTNSGADTAVPQESGKQTDTNALDTETNEEEQALPAESEQAAEAEAEAGQEERADAFDTSITALELAAAMKVGWNLGNSLDAFSAKGLDSETSWGNPKTTQKLVDDIRDMGFTTIRIPVSWGIHADENGHVEEEWMARVKEVVDYAYNDGLYIVLNSHHDNSYYDIGGCAESEDSYQESLKKMSGLWTEIAETFKGYDERLIFETMNEPRTEGSANEWSGGTEAEREIVYGLNDAIVSAIRATGGNNTFRFIMVPCYGANSQYNILSTMKLPEDDRIMVSVHAYTPYVFAMQGEGGTALFSASHKSELDSLFRNLNVLFVKKGIPVVIGEFGCTNKDNIEERCAWAEYYISGAKLYGIPCIVWDNNSERGQTGEECFGLYERKSGEWLWPELVETMIQAGE